ncbi:LTA synthase family protein [Planomicrobium okeanokoites]|uniref:LTA synthase family protein n=1 Tax=Planomicrobium okeanokoites TaxID=244 RepID=UPI00248FEBCD|nr:alkaline phosphatase family protein [Planomicrobium okeanokoites]
MKLPKLNKTATRILTILFMVALPIATLIVSELIVRQVLTLPIGQWFADFDKRVFVNAFLVLALFNLFYILPRRWFMLSGIILSILLLVFAVANKIKMELRSSPVALGDFYLLDELGGFELPVDFNIPLLAVAGIGLLLLIAAIFLAVPRIKENWLLKAGVFLLSAFFLFALWTDKPFSPMKQANFQTSWWKLEIALMQNGVLGNFVMLAKEAEVEPPEGYSVDKLEEIGAAYEPAPAQENSEKPNVIFIMSESFADPYFFGEQHFKQDPIPNFRKYYNESLHGSMYSPEFGGGTANVEFEALTGFSMQFMRADFVPYQLFVKKPLPSAAHTFRKAGYETTAIHTYFGWFYQRESVYKQLGFDQFISGDFMDLDRPNDPSQSFPEDKHITDSTLETLDYTEGPDFIHAVAAEGHVPYWQKEKSDFLKDGTLPPETQPYLNYYTAVVNNVDKELGRLIENLEQRDEPSIVVFFGDHFPAFPNGNELYGANGAGVVDDMLNDYDDYLATHKVPYFIWKSDGNEARELDLSPNQFGPITMEMAGVEGNVITAILDRMREKDEAVVPYAQWKSKMGGNTEEMEDLKVVQYDWLHGKRHIADLLPDMKVAAAPDYHLGLYPEMTVQKVTEKGDLYEIFVEGAPKYAKLLVDGEPIEEIAWRKAEEGVAAFSVSQDLIGAGADIQLAVLNSHGAVLSKTEMFKMETVLQE